MKPIILKCFLKKTIRSDDSNDSNDSNEKVSMKEIRLMKIKCINLYLKSKRISKKFVFQAQTCPT